jgi:CubicO group peptidase (beta-lactamase class C family)
MRSVSVVASFVACAWLAGCAYAPVPAPATAPAPPDTSAAPALDAAQRALLVTHVRAESFRGESPWATLRASATPLALRSEPMDLDAQLSWTADGQSRTLRDYLARQPVTALLIAKDGRIVYERYRYGATRESLFASQSIAKSILGIAAGTAIAQGRIAGVDEPLRRYLPELGDSNLGRSTLRDHLRMGTGLRYVESYRPGDDHARFGSTAMRAGLRAALAELRDNPLEHPPGTHFSYAGFSTAALSVVLREATGANAARALEDALWTRLGTEAPARWQEDRQGVTLGYCCFLARARDYLRLAWVLANGGARPDDGTQVVPRAFVDETFDPQRAAPPFRRRPGWWGYSNQFWILGGPDREWAMLGIHGQAIFANPRARLVMVHFAVGPTARAGDGSLGRERDALWRAVVAKLGG